MKRNMDATINKSYVFFDTSWEKLVYTISALLIAVTMGISYFNFTKIDPIKTQLSEQKMENIRLKSEIKSLKTQLSRIH